jgi:hypothetical protein
VSKRLRQAQHRPERDVKHAHEVADLKRENHKLAREKAALQKQLKRAITTRDMFEDVETKTVPVNLAGSPITTEVIEHAAERMRKEMGGPACPNGCGPLKVLDLGPKTASVCPVCKYRSTRSV